MPGLSNLQAVLLPMNNWMNSSKKQTHLKANWIRMVRSKNTPEILILTGPSKMTSLIMGLKAHASIDTDNGFILSTTLTPSSHNDSKYFSYAVLYSMHTKDKIRTAYADKGYAGAPNRGFLALNHIHDGIMRKDNINAKLIETEIPRNKAISRFRYIVEQYFGVSHLHDNGNRVRFTKLMKNIIDLMFRQLAFNLRKGAKILEFLPVWLDRCARTPKSGQKSFNRRQNWVDAPADFFQICHALTCNGLTRALNFKKFCKIYNLENFRLLQRSRSLLFKKIQLRPVGYRILYPMVSLVIKEKSYAYSICFPIMQSG